MEGSEDEYQDFEDLEGTFTRVNDKFDQVSKCVQFCYQTHEED